jgi:hypothetical protein
MMNGGQHDAEMAYRMGTYMWTRYREEQGKRSLLLGYLVESEPAAQEQIVPVDRIAAIAVWDTVGSLGIPVFKDREGKLADIYKLADRKLSSKVRKAFHAVAVDEERVHFEPTLWEPQPNIKQVWFAGAHSDVDGGHPAPCLSDISLSWMARHLETESFAFNDLDDIKAIEKYIPCHEPWKVKPFSAFPVDARSCPDDIRVHPSVAWLMQNFPDKCPARSLKRSAGMMGRWTPGISTTVEPGTGPAGRPGDRPSLWSRTDQILVQKPQIPHRTAAKAAAQYVSALLIRLLPPRA